MKTVGIGETLVEEIVRRLLTMVRPDRIILFGSAATGKLTPDSDIDLLFVAAAPVNTPQEYARIRRALRGLHFPVDVLQIPSDKSEMTKDLFGGIADPAPNYGRVIYDAAA